MELDSLIIAVEGVGFDSEAVATCGFSFDVFEFEEVEVDVVSTDFRLYSNRRPRGRSSRWKRERRVVVFARLNKTWLDESTLKMALAEQFVDDDQLPIRVFGQRVTFEEVEPLTVSVSEFKVNSIVRIRPQH